MRLRLGSKRVASSPSRNCFILAERIPACISPKPPFDTVNLQIKLGADPPRAYCFLEWQWHERHTGKIDVDTLVERLLDLDVQKNSWASVFISYELSPAEASGMSPADIFSALLRMQPLRELMRTSRK